MRFFRNDNQTASSRFTRIQAKSLYNVEECIYAVTKNNPDAIIVDFFAGSGTTGHAVFELNKLYGGNRKVILCTNNEVGEKREKEFKKNNQIENIDYEAEIWESWKQKYGIASSVTYPRLRSCLNGFSHNKKYKSVLYEKKLSVTNLKKMDKLLQEIDKIMAENTDKYDKIEVIVEDSHLRLYGVFNSKSNIEGFNANLKYFKCDWIPRHPEDSMLSNLLCQHTREMIELQNHIEIDNVKNVLILNRDDLSNYLLDDEAYEKIENVWVNQNIVLSIEELKLLEKKHFKDIPREFFSNELREVGE